MNENIVKPMENETDSEKAEKTSKDGEMRSVSDVIHEHPPLTLKRFIVLFSLTLLWLSAAAPVFFITASFRKSIMSLGLCSVYRS
jgi:hypothetical protein